MVAYELGCADIHIAHLGLAESTLPLSELVISNSGDARLVIFDMLSFFVWKRKTLPSIALVAER